MEKLKGGKTCLTREAHQVPVVSHFAAIRVLVSITYC